MPLQLCTIILLIWKITQKTKIHIKLMYFTCSCTCMYEHVLTQVASIIEDLATHITFVLLLTRGMFSHMSII